MTTWLFDYDLTLYGFDEAEVIGSLDRNITQFLVTRFGLSLQDADAKRRGYCATYGTTLGGLRALHGIAPQEYFDFIHGGESLQLPKPNRTKREWLLGLPGRRLVFTNARRDWAQRGLESMQILDCFEDILDIESFAWDSKPNPVVYAQVESRLGCSGSELIMIEDKAENLEPARKLGWRTVLVHPECVSAKVECDLKLPHLLDLNPSHYPLLGIP
jgi:putative hydrolase of the HAD superfamily